MTVSAPVLSRGRFGFSEMLLCLWIALLGADRVDMLGGALPVVMTPFLVLTPIVIVVEWIRRQLSGAPLLVARRTQWYILIAILLLATVVLSVFASGDTGTSTSRAGLLVAQMLGTLAVALLVADRPDLGRLLAGGAIAGLMFFAVFNVLELLAYVGRQSDILHLGPISVSLAPFRYGLIPRLAGPVNDPNRGGFVLLAYLFLVQVFGPPGTVRRLGITAGIVLLPLTISRSALLAAAVTMIVALLEPRWRQISARGVFGVLMVCASCITVVMVSPRTRDLIGVSAVPLVGRLNFQEQSAQDHFSLLERGLDVVTVSGARAATGIGYGSAYLVLQDIFPGNRYGNFHSLYVSMLAESGVFALALTLILLAVPAVRSGQFRALIAGAAVFSVFYQATTEPVFWLLLVFAWMPVFAVRATPTSLTPQ